MANHWFRVQQVGDQFAVGNEHDPGEQRCIVH